jgi:hypothetical protein
VPGKQADVAQLVERNLAKVEVASSSLVVRSERVLEPIQRWVGREARQRTANPFTRVQIPYPPRHQPDPWAIGAAVARFPDTEEVTGSIPVSPTSVYAGQRPVSRHGTGLVPLRAQAVQGRIHSRREPIPDQHVDTRRHRDRRAAREGLRSSRQVTRPGAPELYARRRCSPGDPKPPAGIAMKRDRDSAPPAIDGALRGRVSHPPHGDPPSGRAG